MPTDTNYGMLTEQGDLGLGFSVLTEPKKETVQKEEETKKDDK